LNELNKLPAFEETIIPHWKAAYNFARWLTRNDEDAADIVQEAYLKAYKFFDGYRGGDSKSWLFSIVRNTFYTKCNEKKTYEHLIGIGNDTDETLINNSDPEVLYIQKENIQLLKDALGKLPLEFREVIILREIEGFSYKEISDVLGIPQGTVMSRIARGRKHLYRYMIQKNKNENYNELQ
jgi:RNA polymerase sigma-70 factor (ECF subfamily)